MTGYDDTRLRGTGRATIDRRRGQFYRDYWDGAARFVGPDQPFLPVTSFNEWHEGTELVPSTDRRPAQPGRPVARRLHPGEAARGDGQLHRGAVGRLPRGRPAWRRPGRVDVQPR